MERICYSDSGGSNTDCHLVGDLVQIRMVSLIAIARGMIKGKNLWDIFWIILAWLIAGAFVYLFLIKLKLLVH